MPTYKYPPELLADAAAKSISIAGVLRVLGIRWSGGSHAHISRQLKKFGIDTSHFLGAAHNRGGTSQNRRSPEDRLVQLPVGSGRTPGFRLRRAMRSVGVPECCKECGVGTSWQGGQLILHVDHINGDFLDNRRENLRFLCPNCHSQTSTYAGRNTAAVASPHRSEIIAFAVAHSDLGCRAISRALRTREADPIEVSATKVLAILTDAGLGTRAERRGAVYPASGEGGDVGELLD